MKAGGVSTKKARGRSSRVGASAAACMGGQAASALEEIVSQSFCAVLFPSAAALQATPGRARRRSSSGLCRLSHRTLEDSESSTR